LKPQNRENEFFGSRRSDLNELDEFILHAQSIDCDVPKTFNEVENRADKIQWQQAIKEELDSLEFNKTWSLVPKPEDKNIVDCKWIFTIKKDEFGKPKKHKARLVARGFSQKIS